MPRLQEAPPKDRPVIAYVSEADRDLLDDIARQRGASRAAVAREFIRAGLVAHRAPALEADQVERLRRLLPPVTDDSHAA